MVDSLPVVLVPGLLTSPRLYFEQLPELWRFGPVIVAANTRDDSMSAIARHLLAAAPPNFALAGLSMGGYIAFEVLRQAPQRIAKLALLDTAARADTPEQSARRREQIGLALDGRLADVVEQQLPLLLNRAHRGEERLQRIVWQMAQECGAEAFVRQQTAIIQRPDSRAGLAAIGCSTLVLVGEDDELTPPERSVEMADAIPGARLVRVPDAGHLSTIERPREVNQALVEWLRS